MSETSENSEKPSIPVLTVTSESYDDFSVACNSASVSRKMSADVTKNSLASMLPDVKNVAIPKAHSSPNIFPAVELDLVGEKYSQDDLEVQSLNKPSTLDIPLMDEGDYESDSSWACRITTASDDSEVALSEAVLMDEDCNKIRKKKSVQLKFRKMKNMLKKTFSDVDATPESELLFSEWNERTNLEKALREGNMPKTKTKYINTKTFREAFKRPVDFQVLSPSYRQKNEDFHKFFKNLPESERLLVDCTCALMKDILTQGRMYVSQNFVCFRSNILKWETVVQMPFKDIVAIHKVKTAKVFPNAIQFQLKSREKPHTFTSFTQRDRSYQLIHKLWHNALMDKPMTPQELWKSVHQHYGSDLGCSSDEDYVKPASDSPDGVTRQFGNEKGKRKKKPKNFNEPYKIDCPDSRFAGTPSETPNKNKQWSGDDRSSGRESIDEQSDEEDNGSCGMLQCDEDDGPADHVKEDLKRVYMSREFNVSAEKMFHTIFGDYCGFWNHFHVVKGSFDVVIGQWREGDDDYASHKTRRLDYNLSLNNPLGPKCSRVDEMQVLYKESEPGRSYGVDCTARTHGVPYSDYFSTIMRYCVRKLSNSTCELRVTAEVKYHKNPWGLVKNFIEKNVHSGMVENFQLLERELDKYFLESCSENSPTQRTLSEQHSSSVAGSIRRRLPNSSASGDVLQSEEYKNTAVPNGHVSQLSDSMRDEVNAAPTTSPLAAPTNSYGKQYRSNVSSSYYGGKWLSRVAVLVFFVLLWSNYTMYQRLNTLEALHSRLSSNGIDLSAFDLNSVYGPDASVDVKISKSLLELDRRLARLEGVVENQGLAADKHSQHIRSDVKSLQETVNKLLVKIDSNPKT